MALPRLVMSIEIHGCSLGDWQSFGGNFFRLVRLRYFVDLPTQAS